MAFALGLLASSHVPEPVAECAGASTPVLRPTEDDVARQPEHDWVLQREKHWQIRSSDFEEPEVTDAVEGNRGRCEPGMIEVQGKMKHDTPWFSIERAQAAACTLWAKRAFPEQCIEFDEPAWQSWIADVPTKKMSFCIDRYEYPNVKGQYPWILVTWVEAVDLCEEQGKRLCSEEEWTFACEGEEARPYPYGFARSSDICVIDRPWRSYDHRAWQDRSSRSAMLEVDRLWQGEASGARPSCRSPFGAYDMTGNVDEWTASTAPSGNRSILKGGYWGEVRDRCRPSTRVHGESFALYQQGFRCCADSGGRDE